MTEYNDYLVHGLVQVYMNVKVPTDALERNKIAACLGYDNGLPEGELAKALVIESLKSGLDKSDYRTSEAGDVDETDNLDASLAEEDEEEEDYEEEDEDEEELDYGEEEEEELAV